MSKHTKGPWFAVLNTAKSWDVNVEPSHYGQSVASCVANSYIEGSPEANANLIAAAPELLEALKLLLERKWQYDEGSTLNSILDAMENARSQAKAAIAKAEGKA